MNEFPLIRFSRPKFNEEIDIEFSLLELSIIERFKNIISGMIKSKIWDENIKEVIFAFDMNNVIEEINQKWGTHHQPLSNEKEFFAVAKSMYNPNGEYAIILPFSILLSKSNIYDRVEQLDQLFTYQVLSVFSKSLLNDEQYKQWRSPSRNESTDVEQTIKWHLLDWCCQFYTNKLYNTAYPDQSLKPSSHTKFLINFKRNLRKILYLSQSDEEKTDLRWYYLWNRYVDNFASLIRRLLDNQTTDNTLLMPEGEESRILYGIISEIENNFENLKTEKPLQTFKIVQFFKELARLYNIHIFNDPEKGNGLHFKFYTDPKKLFKNEIIETEQRIVAFVDILGFKNMIEEYDNNPSSTLLQDIQEVFDQSVKNTFDQYRQNVKDKYLEYKLFSDNLCASIPFYDSEEDFLTQFQILVHLIIGYQSMMMGKGYLVRGAITIGSYYSDDNMIFSGGLVQAYQLESKKDGAIFPRIILDDVIIERLKAILPEKYEAKGNKDLIVSYETDVKYKYFLNPYIDVKYAMQQVKPALSELLTDDDPEFSKTLETLKNLLESFIDLQTSLIPEENTSISTQVNVIQLILDDKISQLDVNNEIEKEVLRKLDWLSRFNNWIINQNTPEFKFYLPNS